MRHLILTLVLLFAMAMPAAAFTYDEPLPDPDQEARALSLSRELRCMVCQNQSIFDSDADLARDLRRIVRERIADGDSDSEVKAYLVARYGDFVLFRPPFKASTYALWFGPVVILLLGVLVVRSVHRRNRGRTAAPALSAEERRRIEAMLRDSS